MPQLSIEKLDPNFAVRHAGNDLLWFDVRTLGVEGRGFDDTKEFYDRLPADAEKVVRPPVWELQKHSAGIAVRFTTDAQKIGVRWKLRFPTLAMPHMPATGCSGIDLYRRENGRFRWIGICVPSVFPENTSELQASLKGGADELMLYMPLYNGVESVEIGVAQGAMLAKAPHWPGGPHKPICFYGTSITHGGCASRPGMAYPAIIGRMLDRPTINIGFSGNGQGEPELAERLARIDPSVYVLDPVPNMQLDWIYERMTRFVQILRAAHPQTPIVLVEHVVPARVAADVLRDSTGDAIAPNVKLRAAYNDMLKAGVRGLHLVPARHLLGDDFEATVDGIHPTDVGFQRMAAVIGAALKPLV